MDVREPYIPVLYSSSLCIHKKICDICFVAREEQGCPLQNFFSWGDERSI